MPADTKCNLAHGNYDTSEFAYVLTFDLFGDYYYATPPTRSRPMPTMATATTTSASTTRTMDDALNTLKSAIEPAAQVEAAYADPGRLHRPGP